MLRLYRRISLATDDETSCRVCRFFFDDPLLLEAQLPGIGALSSAFGSTRGNAGICEQTGRFHDPLPPCDAFEAAGRSGSVASGVSTR